MKQENTCELDYKLDYMARMFKKISHKKIETYVIQRIWHLLNNTNVKFVTQQYIKRNNEEYALVDLYLPQLSMAIEINEPFHYRNIEKVESDRKRYNEISNVIKEDPLVVDCTVPIDEIHKCIDEIVVIINDKIKELGEKFIPWKGEDSMTAQYYQNKGFLDANCDEYVRTIDEICAIFNTKAIHRGYLRAGSAKLKDDDTIVWFPNANSKIWKNKIEDNGNRITEISSNSSKRDQHIQKVINENKKRIVFFKEKDEYGFGFYKFMGLYELDKDNSIKKCIWNRKSERIEIIDYKNTKKQML